MQHVLYKYLRLIFENRKKRLQKLKTEEKGGSGTEEAQLPRGESDDDAKQKKKSDDLWASFLSEVGSRPTGSAPAAPSGSTHEVKKFERQLFLEDGSV